MGYIGQIQALVDRVGPYFVKNRNIGTFLQSVAFAYDSKIQDLDLGLRLGQPLRCDVSALPILSVDRSIPFYPTEPESSKRYRLSRWKQLHRQRGTHVGELKHSQPYFLPDTPVMRIVHQNGSGTRATWHTLNADGSYSIHKQEPSNWDYDGATAKWSRFWFILYCPTRLLGAPIYDDGHAYSDGTLYGGGSTLAVAQDMVRLVREWQGAHSVLWAYILATDPASFDPEGSETVYSWGGTSMPVGNWGQPLSPSGVRTREPSAIWLYSKGQG